MTCETVRRVLLTLYGYQPAAEFWVYQARVKYQEDARILAVQIPVDPVGAYTYRTCGPKLREICREEPEIDYLVWWTGEETNVRYADAVGGGE